MHFVDYFSLSPEDYFEQEEIFRLRLTALKKVCTGLIALEIGIAVCELVGGG